MSIVDGEQQRLRLRSLIKWLFVFVTIGGILLGTLIRPSDAFPSVDIVQHVHPTWVGGAAAFVTFALGMMFWASNACRLPNSKSPLISQAITGSLLLCALNGFMFWVAGFGIAEWIARSTAKTDAIYLTTVEPRYLRGCVNAVEWYDPTLQHGVTFCTNLAIFGRNDGRRSREAIAHVLRGPSGIRVVTIRALDTSLGQEDLSAMRAASSRAKNPLSVPE